MNLFPQCKHNAVGLYFLAEESLSDRLAVLQTRMSINGQLVLHISKMDAPFTVHSILLNFKIFFGQT